MKIVCGFSHCKRVAVMRERNMSSKLHSAMQLKRLREPFEILPPRGKRSLIGKWNLTLFPLLPPHFPTIQLPTSREGDS